MLKHLLKILWNQRRQNGWIFAELTLVFIALWLVCDLFIVRIYTYYRPLGYNVENCWRLSFGNYPSTAAEYVSDTTLQLTNGEAMLQILDRMRHMPQVESACVAFYSSPYSFGNSWTSILPCSADSARFSDKSFHRYVVSLDYFDVFRVKDKSGAKINTGESSQLHDGILVTPELEHEFFGELSAARRSVKYPNATNDIKITAVTNSIRPDDFKKPEAALIQLMNDQEIMQQTDEYGYSPNDLEVTVRMKSSMTQDEMNDFIASKGNGLSAGNLYVNGVSSWMDQRDNILKDSFQSLTVFSLIAVFTLLNVFFGITGTFWLRIEQRRAETGLRMALGSTHRRIGWFFTSEGWLLMSTVLPLALIVIFNLCYVELPDTRQMDMTAWRFILGFLVTFILMGTMIGVGSWIPARRAMKLQPAEALHYE